jgi:hypothetical protein
MAGRLAVDRARAVAGASSPRPTYILERISTYERTGSATNQGYIELDTPLIHLALIVGV